MKIKLKDLVWKEIDIVKELNKLDKQWCKNYHKVEEYHLINNFYFDNAEQIAKEKAEILNKKYEYTKDNIIEMFVEAGFQFIDKKLFFTTKEIIFHIDISEMGLYFKILNDMTIKSSDYITESKTININNRKSIEFYYNKFREILEFEVTNERN